MISRRQFLVAAGAVGIAAAVAERMLVQSYGVGLLSESEHAPTTIRNMQQMVRPRTGFLEVISWDLCGTEMESRQAHFAIARGGDRKHMLELHAVNPFAGSVVCVPHPDNRIMVTRDFPIAFGADFDGFASVVMMDDQHRIFNLQMLLSRTGGAMATELIPVVSNQTHNIELGFHPTSKGLLS